jgi:hypothetical protein
MISSSFNPYNSYTNIRLINPKTDAHFVPAIASQPQISAITKPAMPNPMLIPDIPPLE